MLVPLALLALGAVVSGFAFKDVFFGAGQEEFWKEALTVGKDNKIIEEMEHVPHLVSLLPTIMMVGGFLLAYFMYIVKPGSAKAVADSNPVLYRFLLNKWYFDELYNLIFVRPAFWLGEAHSHRRR